jgi:hypothetical protein
MMLAAVRMIMFKEIAGRFNCDGLLAFELGEIDCDLLEPP